MGEFLFLFNVFSLARNTIRYSLRGIINKDFICFCMVKLQLTTTGEPFFRGKTRLQDCGQRELNVIKMKQLLLGEKGFNNF